MKIRTNLQQRFNRRYNWRAEQYFKPIEKEKMITKEHLKHWINEINYQLTGIIKEISADKVIMKGINVGKTGESFVSFEYLQEKSNTIQKLLDCIEWDVTHDESSV